MNSLVSLNTIRTGLQSARGRSASAESHFKTLESEGDGLRRTTLSVETYEARHDAEGKDVSDEGKAAVKTTRGVAAKHQTLKDIHGQEEADRRQLGNDLSGALGASQALALPVPEKSALLQAISSAQQTDQSVNWHYQSVDTALFAANLRLGPVLEQSGIIAGDNKGKDVSLNGQYLRDGLERLAASFTEASSAAGRSEQSQDTVGVHIETALREVDRLEDKAVQPFLDDVPFVAYAAREFALNQLFGPLLADGGSLS